MTVSVNSPLNYLAYQCHGEYPTSSANSSWEEQHYLHTIWACLRMAGASGWDLDGGLAKLRAEHRINKWE